MVSKKVCKNLNAQIYTGNSLPDTIEFQPRGVAGTTDGPFIHPNTDTHAHDVRNCTAGVILFDPRRNFIR